MKGIAEKAKKTPAQVCLRWNLEKGRQLRLVETAMRHWWVLKRKRLRPSHVAEICSNATKIIFAWHLPGNAVVFKSLTPSRIEENARALKTVQSCVSGVSKV